jgi:hypothetical protein
MSPSAAPRQEKTGSVAGLVGQAFIGLCVLVAIIAVAARQVAPLSKVPDGLPVLSSTVLADGTTVNVVAVTAGAGHSLVVPRRANNGWDRFWGHRRVDTVTTHSGKPALMVWLTRHRAGSSSMLVFEALRSGRIEWGANRSLPHETVHQRVQGVYGGSGSTGTPPFSSTSTHPDDIVLTNLQFPLISDPGGPVKLRLLGDAGAELGVIEVPLPTASLPVAPVWIPLPLPQTQTVGRYSVTLTTLDPEEVAGGFVTLRPKFEATADGKPVTNFVQQTGALKDPLGNVGGQYHCILDRHATAWSLPLHAQFRIDPTVEPESVWKSPPMAFPSAPNETVPVDVHGKMRGGRVDVHLARMCGSKSPPLWLTPGTAAPSASRNWSYGTSVFHKPVRIESKEVAGRPALEVTGPFPFVFLEATGQTSGETLVITEAKDDVSRDVPFQEFQHDGAFLCFLDPLPDAKTVSLGFAMNERVDFEFRIAPPPPVTPPAP